MEGIGPRSLRRGGSLDELERTRGKVMLLAVGAESFGRPLQLRNIPQFVSDRALTDSSHRRDLPV